MIRSESFPHFCRLFYILPRPASQKNKGVGHQSASLVLSNHAGDREEEEEGEEGNAHPAPVPKRLMETRESIYQSLKLGALF